ncbi:phage tail tape measure protein [Chitinimonas arctica]|uniref:Phage tail tape measure protein n=1 Tax=Chitinimonas arctica TaxID=2594795 RepID=A0A516SEX1_9NEIS|nr:phage tail tape measure protein [Chitinimonas arctica]QDQ26701.1 phage tail tape measure protein [Chitinimonas arctica]
MATGSNINIVLSAEDRTQAAFERVKAQALDVRDRVDQIKSAALGVATAVGVNLFAGWVKGSIDAMDALNDLSERTGIAADRLSAYGYAAQLSGTNMDSLATGIKDFSKSIVASDPAFKAMGVSLKDNSGQLKSTEVLLEEVADRFAGYQDGASKSALAMQLFGKSGMELIPFLNNGKAGLAELRAEAERLGLVMSADAVAGAAAFNDQVDRLKAVSSGYAGRLTAELLPTLNSVSDSLMGTASQSGGLRIAIDALAFGVKGLVSIAYGVIAVFDQIGSAISAAAATAMAGVDTLWQASKAASKASLFDFSGAKQELAGAQDNYAQIGHIRDAAQEDAARKNDEYDSKVRQIWADMPKAAGTAAEETAKNLTAPLTASAKKVESTFDKLSAQLQANYLASLRALSPEYAKLTKSEQDLVALVHDKSKGWDTLQPKEQAAIRRQVQLIAEQERGVDALKAFEKSQQSLATAYASGLEKNRAILDAARDEAAQYGLSKTAIDALTLSKREALLVDLQRQQLVSERRGEDNPDLNDRIRLLSDEIAMRREALEISTGTAARKAADDAAEAARDAWKKTTDSLADNLTDALWRGFEGGKGFLENFKTTAINAFKTMILRPSVQAVVTPAAGGVGGFAQVAGQAGGGGMDLLSIGKGIYQGFATGFQSLSGGNLVGGLVQDFASSSFGQGMGLANTAGQLTQAGGDLVVNASSFADSATSFVSWASTAVDVLHALGTGEGIGKAAGSAIGTMILPGIGTLIGSFLGGAIDKAFGGGGGPKSGGEAFSQAGTRRQLFTPNQADQGLQATVAGLSLQYAALMKSIGGTAQTMNFGLGFDSDPAGSAQNRISSRVYDASGKVAYESINHEVGRDDEKLKAEMGVEVGRLLLAAVKASNPAEEYAKVLGSVDIKSATAEQVKAMTEQLTAIGQVKAAFEGFGKVLPQLSGLSYATQQKLVALAGGLQNLSAGVESYYQNFYSESERRAMATGQLAKQFEALGLVMPTTREGFRQLVDGLGTITDANAGTYAALIGLNTAFANVVGVSEAAANATEAATSAENRLAAARGQQSSLFDKYASDSAKLAKAQVDLIAGFGGLGKAVPKSAAELLDMASAADPMTTAGQRLLAVISGLTDAFDLVQGAAKSADEAARQQADTALAAAQSRANEWAAAGRGLDDYLRKLNYTDNSPLSTEQRYASARNDYDALKARVKGGDVGAVGDLQGAGEQLLSLGREMFARSSGNYAQLYEGVSGDLRGVATTASAGGYASAGVDTVNELKRSNELLARQVAAAEASNKLLEAQVRQASAVAIENKRALDELKATIADGNREARQRGGSTRGSTLTVGS